MTAGELQTKPGVPVFLKKLDLLDINEIGAYFTQLKKRNIKRLKQSGERVDRMFFGIPRV
jgi:hypothetical protein